MKSILVMAGAVLVGWAGGVQAGPITRYALPVSPQGKPARILQSVEVSSGATMLYVSGQLASPINPKQPMGPDVTMVDLGDSRTQTVSALTKIKAILAGHGFTMSDIIKMTLFIAPDPKMGKMDFDGVNAGFEAFFNTPDNPTTVARSAFQVAALAGPAFLVEIEVTAAKAAQEAAIPDRRLTRPQP